MGRRRHSSVRPRWARYAFGLFAVEIKESGGFAGFCGLSIPNFLPEILPAVEIGWRLARASWGRGYATEAASASMHFGFIEAGLDEIVSIHQIENTPSERIMEIVDLDLLPVIIAVSVLYLSVATAIVLIDGRGARPRHTRRAAAPLPP